MRPLAETRFQLSTNWFLAPADRRYRLVKAYLRQGLRRPFRDDLWTRELWTFLSKLRSCRRSADRLKLRRPYHALSIALDIRRGKLTGLRPLLEAYLLTELDDEAIAAKLGIPSAVVQWYRKAFFDIDHLRKSPLRVLHQVIRIVDEDGRPSLDNHKVWRLVAFVLGFKALDQLLGIVQTDGVPEGGASDWVALQTELVAKVQRLLAVGALNPNNPQQIAALLKPGPGERVGAKEREGVSHNLIERHVKALIEDIPWPTGSDAEALYKGTEVGKFDESAIELRADELLTMAAGGKVPGLDGLVNFKMPPPTKKMPDLGFKTGQSPLDGLKPQK